MPTLASDTVRCATHGIVDHQVLVCRQGPWQPYVEKRSLNEVCYRDQTILVDSKHTTPRNNRGIKLIHGTYCEALL